MTFREFLSERINRMIIQIVFAAAASAFLLSTGTQPGILLLLLIFCLLITTSIYLSDFFRQRARLRELGAILNRLDQKYLFTECVPPPDCLYEEKLFELMRRCGRDMIGTVSDAQASEKEYREYIESWVHEIKAPITAAQLICRNVDGEARRKLTHELAQIQAHVQRALFYARAESPEKDFIVRRAALSEIVSRSIQNHRALLIQSGMRIETDHLDQTVYTDDKWACFIIGQLLQNAARYRKEDPVVTIRAHTGRQHVYLTVSDNGIGIPAHELPRVFDRGYTGSNGRARGGSTGMGLYLCRRLAEVLEIGIEIESTQQQGTSVSLTFPASAQ